MPKLADAVRGRTCGLIPARTNFRGLIRDLCPFHLPWTFFNRMTSGDTSPTFGPLPSRMFVCRRNISVSLVWTSPSFVGNRSSSLIRGSVAVLVIAIQQPTRGTFIRTLIPVYFLSNRRHIRFGACYSTIHPPAVRSSGIAFAYTILNTCVW